MAVGEAGVAPNAVLFDLMKVVRWMSVFALLSVAALAQGGAGTELEPWDRFNGEWQPRAGSAKVVEQAIQKTIKSMNALARPIARRRLMEKNVPSSRLRMERRGEVFILQFSKSEVFKLPLSGASVKYGDSTMRIQLDEGAKGLRHTGETAEGRRENVFRLGSDRDTMTMAVTMSSPRLPRPLQYTLEFTRVR